jgi:CheY-like chemotaxis protein
MSGALRRMTDPLGSLEELDVLLVEDDVDVRETITWMLEQAGARVTGCGDGPQALCALQTAVPHVLVMDIRLPGPSGFSVMRTIRHLDDEAARAVPALALSGSIEAFGVEHIVNAGFTEYLSKPVSLERLVRTVGRLAGRGT